LKTAILRQFYISKCHVNGFVKQTVCLITASDIQHQSIRPQLVKAMARIRASGFHALRCGTSVMVRCSCIW